MYIYDPSVSGLGRNDDKYMGDQSVGYTKGIDRHPEYRVFVAAQEAVELYYKLFQIFVVDDPSKYRAVNVARCVLEARTHHYMMSIPDKNIGWIDARCLLLWPGQPVIGDRDASDTTALTLAGDQMNDFIHRVLDCLVFVDGFDPQYENRFPDIGLKDMADIADCLCDSEGREIILECFDLPGDDKSDQQMRTQTQTHLWVLSRSERMYMVDRYDRHGSWANAKSQRRFDISSLSFDDSRCEVLWRNEPIKGLNHEMHYRGLKRLFDARGEIVSNADLHNALKPSDPAVANASGFVEATPQVRDFKTQVNKQLSDLPFSIGNVARLGYSLNFSDPKRTPRLSHDVHTTNVGSS